MKLHDLKKQIQEYQYFEDTKVIDVTLASIISNRLKVSNPVWLILIGASSGGKSQIINPVASSDPQFIHRIDDITENTFLSGAKSKGGENETSFLLREDGLGAHGIISISDLTILLSKNSESRAVILSQFRALFDGFMTKHSGNMKKPLVWQGYAGIIAGSTPSVYETFEEFSDLGERFIYYRMKDFNRAKATNLALTRTLYGKELNDRLSELYGQYVKELTVKYKEEDHPELTPEVRERIIRIANFSETVRTPVKKDWRGEHVTRIPCTAYPMRVALQLEGIAKTLMIMRHNEEGVWDLKEEDLSVLDWIGYSLANEEKRACLKILASVAWEESLSTQALADEIGLNTDVVNAYVQNLSAVGVVRRRGESGELRWCFKNKNDYDLVRRIEQIEGEVEYEDREPTHEELKQSEELQNQNFDNM